MFAYVIRPYVALECTKPSEVEQHVIIQQSSRMPESLRRLAIDAAVEQCKNQTNEIQKCEAVGACIIETNDPGCIESIFSAEKKGLPPVPSENNWQLLKNSSRKLGSLRDIQAANILSNHGQARTAPELPVASRGPVPVL